MVFINTLVSFIDFNPDWICLLEGKKVVKRVSFVMFIGLASAQTFAPEFHEKLVKFHKHYDKFLRTYMGCPAVNREDAIKEGLKFVECDRALGGYDQKEFQGARLAAMDLFELEEKK